MKTKVILEAKRLSATEPGELILISASGDWFGLVLATAPRNTMVALLKPTKDEASFPFYQDFTFDQKCLSYGKDWILKPTVGEGLFRSVSQASFTGGLYLDGNSYVAEFSKLEKDYSYRRLFNLSDQKLVDTVGQDALVFPGWSISLPSTEAENAAPLIEVAPSQMR
jgi:hypothetical protein